MEATATEPDSPAGAAGPTTTAPAAPESRWAYDLAGELMSPFCPGRTLASCPSPQAAELIQWIAIQEAAGVSREDVVRMLVERHGEDILGAPPAKGFALWAYVLPVVGFVGFGAVAFLVLRRIVRPATPATRADPSPGAAHSADPIQPSQSSPSNANAAANASGQAGRATGVAALEAELARIVDAELAERA